MRGLRLCLLVVALGALPLLCGTRPLGAEAPDASLFPRARPGGLGGAVRMTIAEAAAMEAARAAAATRARAASESAAQAAENAQALSAASDRAAAEAMAAVAGGDGGVVISEAAEAEMAAFRARQEAEAARVAAAREEARRIAAERAEARASAAALAASDTPISPMAVARSLFPRPASNVARERFAALALERARSPARTEAPATTPTLARASGGVRGNLCGTPGLEGRVLDRIRSRTQGCGVTEPVSITNVQGIPLSLAATMDCDTARAFERWVRTEMIPAVGRSGGGIAQIRVIGHYSCRTRNSQRGARISEHGRGRAIDVAGYQLRSGESVSVLDDYRRGRHSRSLRRMYEAACGIFRTTLSPDSDRFHQDHFHFDLAQHRGGGTYCR
ncbi:extensin family protein [Rhodobacter sp. NTK016B]|uniref:extensin-like domain-containing protein n=1 Tax=Rhodobacter sp. NTK016B TaxID=2759676 RepID=UPI001A903364|nr:extensin family protein [Rhodobacter sp. NTK016B]MBN8293078.1 extensin family protein [Rhodobacter sp. NTK016B]